MQNVVSPPLQPESDESYQLKLLLNKLLQSLDDEYHDNDDILKQIKELCDKRRINYKAFTQSDVQEQPLEATASQNDISIGDSIFASQEDKVIAQLKAKRDLILSKAEREEYFSKQYEAVIEKYQTLMNVLMLNIKNKTDFEHNYGIVYDNLYQEKMNQYKANIECLKKAIDLYKFRYSMILSNLQALTQQFSEELDKHDKHDEKKENEG